MNFLPQDFSKPLMYTLRAQRSGLSKTDLVCSVFLTYWIIGAFYQKTCQGTTSPKHIWVFYAWNSLFPSMYVGPSLLCFTRSLPVRTLLKMKITCPTPVTIICFIFYHIALNLTQYIIYFLSLFFFLVLLSFCLFMEYLH